MFFKIRTEIKLRKHEYYIILAQQCIVIHIIVLMLTYLRMQFSSVVIK